MKYFALLSGLILFYSASYSQGQSKPMEVTPVIEKKIQDEIFQETKQLKAELEKNKKSDIEMEFSIDTFQIEKYQEKYMACDWSTAGMRHAVYHAAHRYDSLLNKYYQKLLLVLKPADKPALVHAQRAWISFRDNELKLIDTVSKEEYSGGGTMQQLIDASEYSDLIKQRTISIFYHYTRATQGY